MLIPINEKTFKHDFLNGDGKIQFTLGGGNLVSNKPFNEDTKAIEITTVGVTKALSLGNASGLSMDVRLDAGLNQGIELIWPGDDSTTLKRHGIGDVPEGSVGARLFFTGSASGNLIGNMPAGPANFKFGIKGGAEVGYDRVCIYNSDTTSGSILRNLVSGLRLPHHCNDVSRIPREGEVLAFRYNGFLDLNAGVNWGYELTGTRGIDFRDIDAVVDYAARMKASINFGYRLGGEYSIETRRGKRPNWVRVSVRKRADSAFCSAASFELYAKADLHRFPGTADEFLVALLGADARAGLDLFQRIRRLANLDELRKEAGKLLFGCLDALALKWIGKALDNDNVAEFLSIVDRVVDEYTKADDTIIALLNRIIHIYEDYVGMGKIDALKAALAKIAALNNRDSLKDLNDSEVWTVINWFIGGETLSLLRYNEIFIEVTEIAQKALDFINGSWQPQIRDLVHELKTQFGLDNVFLTLKKFTNKDSILNLADEKLQGVVEKLLDVAWEKINKSSAAKFAKNLESALNTAQSFKDTWYERLTDAVNKSFSLQLNYAYTRSTSNDLLIDVEIDLSSARGKELFDDAVHGRFSDLFLQRNFAYIDVYEGVLTHSLSKSSRFRINVFGWSSSRIVQVMSNTKNLIHTGPSGEVQVFMTEAAIKQFSKKIGRDKSIETVESNFLMRFVGETFQPEENSTAARKHLIKAINNMAVEYDMMISDDKTTPDELVEYLDLAKKVGLIDDPRALVEEFKRQFPDGFGKVKANYVVTFDNDGIRDAFTLPIPEIAEIARNVTRQIIRAQLVTGRPTTHNLTLIGMVYLDPEVQKLYDKEGFTAVLNKQWAIEFLKNQGGGRKTLPKPLNHMVISLLHMERTLIKRLSRLYAIIDDARTNDRPVSDAELEESAREFVEMASNLDGTGRLNSFFAVFDALVKEGSNGKGYRESSMILELQTGSDNPVTKYLCAGRAVNL